MKKEIFRIYGARAMKGSKLRVTLNKPFVTEDLEAARKQLFEKYFNTNEYKVTDLRIGNLMYGIEISSLGGEETISGNTVSLSSGKVTAVQIKINNC